MFRKTYLLITKDLALRSDHFLSAGSAPKSNPLRNLRKKRGRREPNSAEHSESALY
jgi:hypothetical protein